MSDQFDPDWYLQTYPDVAAAGVDPWEHYQRYGKNEGRLPRALASIRLDQALWAGFSQLALPELLTLIQDPHTPADETAYAAWALARWYAAQADWPQAATWLPCLCASAPPFLDHLGPRLLALEILLRNQRLTEARSLLHTAFNTLGSLPDLCLAAANARLPLPEPTAPEPDPDTLRLIWINRALQSAGLTPLAQYQADAALSLDNLHALAPTQVGAENSPKISVIMPSFNAAATMTTALRGLLSQTWQNLEIIVVDDASTDDTVAKVQSMAERDSRIILIRQSYNRGAYAARNRGLSHATGVLITNHDSDDWSHPQRLALMAAPLLKNHRIMATLAEWVRCDTDLHFQRWRMERSLIHPSVSTIMFRADAVATLGAWDEVKAGADTEWYERILHLWGSESVHTVLKNVPLVFARQVEGSLTTATATHLKTQFTGARYLYRELYKTWYATTPERSQLYLTASPSRRPFPAPAALTGQQSHPNDYDWVVFADCAEHAVHSSLTRQVIQHLQSVRPRLRLALFHWPDYQRLDPIAPWYLQECVTRKLDMLLADQTATAKQLIMIGADLQQHPPDQYPTITAEHQTIIEHGQDIASLLPGLPVPINLEQARFEIQASGLFDADWYLRHYPDIRQHGVEPLAHYLSCDARESRNPGPDFDKDYYLSQCPEALDSTMPLLLHYLRQGRKRGLHARRAYLRGYIPWFAHRPTVLLCGHAAGAKLFGAERSLLDILDACKALQYNVLVTLPSMANAEYLQALQARCRRILHIPTSFWTADRPVCPQAIQGFIELMQRYPIDLIHVNTIVLREPLRAARQMNIPSVVHVRECPQQDATLCKDIGHSSERIISEVMARADVIVANSHFTAAQLQVSGRTIDIAGNIIDPAKLALKPPAASTPLRIAMISSNQPKKGLMDFVQLAVKLAQKRLPVQMLVFGPETEWIVELRQQQHAGHLPSLLKFAGYTQEPSQALEHTDIVLNLSHVAETFGRTVLEAMAAGRPVMAYHKGALPELITDGVNGFLVPDGDIEALVEKITALCADPTQILSLGQAGQRLAAERNLSRLCEQLDNIYSKTLSLYSRLP